MAEKSPEARVRTRTLGPTNPPVGGVATSYIFGNVSSTQTLGGDAFRGQERTEDELHPQFMEIQKNLSWQQRRGLYGSQFYRLVSDTTGPFSSVKRRLQFAEGKKINTPIPRTGTRYVGTVLPCKPDQYYHTAPDPVDETHLRDWGAMQYAYNTPKGELLDLGQTVAEVLREGIPLKQSFELLRSRPTVQKGSSGYLAYQFGLRPTFEDIYKFARGLETALQRWKRVVKEARELHRVSFVEDIESSTTTTSASPVGGIYPTLPTSLATGMSSTLMRTREYKLSYNFSAAFARYIPLIPEDIDSVLGKVQLYKEMYGLEVDPSLLYELTPWSWLVDWFVPCGRTVEVLTNQFTGNCVSPWATVGYHLSVTDTFTRPGCSITGHGDPGKVVINYDLKKRINADPLGFKIDWPDFDLFQLSILAAIGLSR